MPETKSKEGKKSEDNTAHLACPIEVDRLCMLVFGAIVVCIVVFASIYGEDGLDKVTTYFKSVGDFAVIIVQDNATKDLLAALACLAIFSFVPILLWGIAMIHSCLWMVRMGVVVTTIVVGACCAEMTRWMYQDGLSSGVFIWPAIAGVVICCFIFIFLAVVHHRIAYAVINIEVAAQAIKDVPALFAIGLLVSILGAGWIYAWLVATIGTVEYFDWTPFEEAIVIVTFAFILLWILSVHVNLLKVTVATIVAKWWGLTRSTKITVCDAFTRAGTTYLGSIALGSLFVRLLETFKFFLRSLYYILGGHSEEKEGGLHVLCSPITLCLSGAIMSVSNTMKSMNHYGYVFLGIDARPSLSFSMASTRAHEMLDTRDKETIVSDLLVSFVLGIGKLFCGAITCIAGLYSTDWSWSHDIDDVKVVMGLAGFIFGFFGASIFLSLIESGVNTIHVLWILHPAKLRNTSDKAKRKCFMRLKKAFDENHSSFMEQHKRLLGTEDEDDNGV